MRTIELLRAELLNFESRNKSLESSSSFVSQYTQYVVTTIKDILKCEQPDEKLIHFFHSNEARILNSCCEYVVLRHQPVTQCLINCAKLVVGTQTPSRECALKILFPSVKNFKVTLRTGEIVDLISLDVENVLNQYALSHDGKSFLHVADEITAISEGDESRLSKEDRKKVESHSHLAASTIHEIQMLHQLLKDRPEDRPDNLLEQLFVLKLIMEDHAQSDAPLSNEQRDKLKGALSNLIKAYQQSTTNEKEYIERYPALSTFLKLFPNDSTLWEELFKTHMNQYRVLKSSLIDSSKHRIDIEYDTDTTPLAQNVQRNNALLDLIEAQKDFRDKNQRLAQDISNQLMSLHNREYQFNSKPDQKTEYWLTLHFLTSLELEYKPTDARSLTLTLKNLPTDSLKAVLDAYYTNLSSLIENPGNLSFLACASNLEPEKFEVLLGKVSNDFLQSIANSAALANFFDSPEVPLANKKMFIHYVLKGVASKKALLTLQNSFFKYDKEPNLLDKEICTPLIQEAFAQIQKALEEILTKPNPLKICRGENVSDRTAANSFEDKLSALPLQQQLSDPHPVIEHSKPTPAIKKPLVPAQALEQTGDKVLLREDSIKDAVTHLQTIPDFSSNNKPSSAGDLAAFSHTVQKISQPVPKSSTENNLGTIPLPSKDTVLEYTLAMPGNQNTSSVPSFINDSIRNSHSSINSIPEEKRSALPSVLFQKTCLQPSYPLNDQEDVLPSSLIVEGDSKLPDDPKKYVARKEESKSPSEFVPSTHRNHIKNVTGSQPVWGSIPEELFKRGEEALVSRIMKIYAMRKKDKWFNIFRSPSGLKANMPLKEIIDHGRQNLKSDTAAILLSLGLIDKEGRELSKDAAIEAALSDLQNPTLVGNLSPSNS